MARPRPKPRTDKLTFTYKGESFCCDNLKNASEVISELRKKELYAYTENGRNRLALIEVLQASLKAGRDGITAGEIALLINCSSRAVGPLSRTWRRILNNHGFRTEGGVIALRYYKGMNRWYAGPQAEKAIQKVSVNLTPKK